MKFRIADVLVDIDIKNEYFLNRLSSFSSTFLEKADLKLTFQKSEKICPPQGEMILNEDITFFKKVPDKSGFYGYMTANKSDFVIAAFDSDQKWQNVIVSYVENIVKIPDQANPSDVLAFHFAGIAFRNRIIHLNGIVIHASSIEYNGRGILFSAPSGTGKSTHVRLWEENKEGVRVLNDDTPAIRFIDGEIFLYGTPWSGSSNKFLNKRTPLSSIVLLEQAPENHIRQLAKHESVTRLMPRLFLPYADTQLMDIAMGTFENIVSRIPVYLLSCRPDAEAVEMVYQCVR